jgi:RNA ligase
MNNIKTVQAIANRIAKGGRDFGRVYVKENGPYVLLNYTPEAMYSKDMTEVEKACRGLVIREDGKIMSLCMPRFYNLGEPQCPSLPNEPYTVWEKVDGSLGIFWHDGDRWRCNTRGSFENDYTGFAQDWWNVHILDWEDDELPQWWTFMVEICFDNDPMPRAVHHGEGLYLVAVRDRYSGKDFDMRERDWYGLGFKHPYFYEATTIQEVLDKKSDEGTEGWVVRFESGFRVKIKTTWYLRLFKAVTNLTPKHIRELMLEAGEDWIDEFPDDLRPEAAAIQQELEAQYKGKLQRIYGAYSKIAGIESRKDYALKATADYPDIAGWLFALRDDRFDEVEVLRKMRI